MRYLALAALVAAPCALAKSKAKVNTSVNPVKHLARTPQAAVAARQTGTGEFCGTDDLGDDYYCDDPQTFCCVGPEIWQCAPKTAEECCTTGYYCETGEHCYLSATNEQLCLTPEEAEEEAGGTSTDDDATSTDDLDFGDSGSGSGSSSGSDSDADSTSTDDAEETTGSSSTDDEEDDDSTTVAAGGGGGKRKGGSKGAAGKVGPGAVMAGVVAIGALALV